MVINNKRVDGFKTLPCLFICELENMDITDSSRPLDLRLKHDASMIVSGPTQSGKTTFIQRLIGARGFIFDRALDKVFWYYGVAQPQVHADLRAKGVRMEEGLPPNFDSIPEFSIIVLDDLAAEIQGSKAVTQLFTRVAHHKHCFVILVLQNLFEKSTQLRTRHLNAQYLVLFKNPRDHLQVSILGRQMYPGRSQFLSAVFEDATRRLHGYLLIDNHQHTPDHLRLRTNILPDELPIKVSLAKYKQKRVYMHPYVCVCAPV